MKVNVGKNEKKLFSLLKIIMNITFIIGIIIIFINLSLWDVSNNRISIFNKFGIAVVVSNSMEPVLSVNDLIVIKKANNYNVGDVIVYKSDDELVIHRIVRINKEEIITKGDSNAYEDMPVNLDEVYGKLKFSIPFVGGLISFFKTSYGIFLVVTLIIIAFVCTCRAELKSMTKK